MRRTYEVRRTWIYKKAPSARLSAEGAALPTQTKSPAWLISGLAGLLRWFDLLRRYPKHKSPSLQVREGFFDLGDFRTSRWLTVISLSQGWRHYNRFWWDVKLAREPEYGTTSPMLALSSAGGGELELLHEPFETISQIAAKRLRYHCITEDLK